MISIRLRYVMAIKRPDGRTYFYWRRPGFKQITLSKYGTPTTPKTPGEITQKTTDPAFVAKVNALNAAADQGPDGATDEGAFRWLIRLWEQTEEFKQLRPRTKVNYRYWLRKLSAWDDMPIALLDDQKEGRKLIHAAQKSLAAHPDQANEVIATLKTLIDWAIRAGHMERNPAKTVKKLKTTQRKAVWSAEAESLWLSHADQTMRLAFFLGAYTGQRQADILSLRWDQITGGYISIEQAKTAEAVKVAIHPILAEELERTQRHGDFVLMWQDSRPGHPTDWKPYKDNHFKHAFRRVTLAAGLDGLQFRDLRRTLTTRLSALGVTPQQLSDVSGHRIAHSTKILDTYVARNPGDAVLRLTTEKKP